MLHLFRIRPHPEVTRTTNEEVAARAGELFDKSHNCTQAVLQATTGRSEKAFTAMAEGFAGGIGESGCLCGALAGGVMALGLAGHADRSGRLVAAFRETFGTTCCRGLSSKYRWGSRKHLANCRRITALTAAMVEELVAKR